MWAAVFLHDERSSKGSARKELDIRNAWCAPGLQGKSSRKLFWCLCCERPRKLITIVAVHALLRICNSWRRPCCSKSFNHATRFSLPDCAKHTQKRALVSSLPSTCHSSMLTSQVLHALPVGKSLHSTIWAVHFEEKKCNFPVGFVKRILVGDLMQYSSFRFVQPGQFHTMLS